MPPRYEDYTQVPEVRRHHTVNKLILLGFFLLPPLLWLACVLCLTGDVYTDEVGDDGFLVTVSPATKWGAAVLLAIHGGLCFAILYSWIYRP
jgi:hypothetical protein